VSNIIDRFPFSTPFTTATDVGDLSVAKASLMGQSSSENGYTSGGYVPASPPSAEVIERFPFSTPFTTATNIGSLSQGRSRGTSQSSLTDGYTSGGFQFLTRIDKFPFSTPFTTATNIGSLSQGRNDQAGQSSSDSGYTSGGYSPAPSTNTIDKFPFSTPFTTATDVGDLFQARALSAGQQD
jgi:hypothetical protein